MSQDEELDSSGEVRHDDGSSNSEPETDEVSTLHMRSKHSRMLLLFFTIQMKRTRKLDQAYNSDYPSNETQCITY